MGTRGSESEQWPTCHWELSSMRSRLQSLSDYDMLCGY